MVITNRTRSSIFNIKHSTSKEDVIRKLKGNLFVSPLHEKLHNTLKKQMCPTVTILFSVLKDVTPFQMVCYML